MANAADIEHAMIKTRAKAQALTKESIHVQTQKRKRWPPFPTPYHDEYECSKLSAKALNMELRMKSTSVYLKLMSQVPKRNKSTKLYSSTYSPTTSSHGKPSKHVTPCVIRRKIQKHNLQQSNQKNPDKQAMCCHCIRVCVKEILMGHLLELICCLAAYHAIAFETIIAILPSEFTRTISSLALILCVHQRIAISIDQTEI
jgi:hypothetical protein